MIGGHALATAVQLAGIGDALYFAHGFSTAARLIESDVGLKRGLRIVKFAFLNRACELACAPVHLRPVETSNGIDYAWYTYSPVARKPQRVLPPHTKMPTQWRYVPVPSEIEPVYLGLETDLTEDQARCRAMGW